MDFGFAGKIPEDVLVYLEEIGIIIQNQKSAPGIHAFISVFAIGR